jgi:hypothetical protein
MAEYFHLKRGDTSPSLLYRLIPQTVDLTGATARFSMKNAAGAVIINRRVATIVTAVGTPTVRNDWQAGDTVALGTFFGEFEVEWPGGVIETFPNFGNIHIIIAEDIA